MVLIDLMHNIVDKTNQRLYVFTVYTYNEHLSAQAKCHSLATDIDYTIRIVEIEMYICWMPVHRSGWHESEYTSNKRIVIRLVLIIPVDLLFCTNSTGELNRVCVQNIHKKKETNTLISFSHSMQLSNSQNDDCSLFVQHVYFDLSIWCLNSTGLYALMPVCQILLHYSIESMDGEYAITYEHAQFI